MFGVKSFIKVFSNNKLTPMAVIRLEILGEFLRGLYAILSVKVPKITHIIIAGNTVSHTGNPILVKIGILNNETYAPTIMISP